ncbi:hypothetical protein ACS7SF_00415 [Ralstonia sp. 25C]|uniref:hypothetical protein n=1 Tax=Ralstonia sp. 25C TaxID=3447363 RepID=UPI003F7500A4
MPGSRGNHRTLARSRPSSVDRQTKGVDAVPGLSKIPLRGALFRHDQTSGQRFQRLFFLTPRVVVL